MDIAECVDSPSGPTPRILLEYKYPEIYEVKQAYPFNHHKVDTPAEPSPAPAPSPSPSP